MKEKIFVARRLTKKYKKSYALNGLDMEICRGSIYGFVGKNGAGKTTLMRILTGRAVQTDGEIGLFGEKQQSKMYIQRKRVGAMVEGPAFYPGMTAKDNLEVVRLQKGIEDKGCIKEILEIVGLEDTGTKKARNFSLGMKQRLGIAIALMGKPELLVLDEPVNGLDPEGIASLRELLKKLNQEQGMTILVSSHILSELDQLATCYGFINKGKMIEQVTTEELFKKCEPYLNMRVNDVQKAAHVLRKMFPGNRLEIVTDKQLCLYNFSGNTADVMKECLLNEVDIKEIRAEGASLEKYYMELMKKVK
ncbi:MAG: ATP-binding cassette domain-containing protein [Lachnospiraceae bacterium]|jgi:ABC-type multidrug transport system, ATPase component|nr:ATP-binding cassette domain-containing protein [Lachnospiraceae bacterium]